LAPDVTFVTFTTEGDNLTYHGPAGVTAWMRDFLGTWRDLRIQANDFLEVEDRVLALYHQRAEGRQSGVKVEMPVFAVWTFRDGQVVGLHWLRDRAEAFRTAGLVE
jgi:ketosteroid isomerase-like protein